MSEEDASAPKRTPAAPPGLDPSELPTQVLTHAPVVGPVYSRTQVVAPPVDDDSTRVAGAGLEGGIL